MKFISIIASTMLIVLISQQSMGLPLNSTVATELCSKGLEMINGHCMPIQSSTIGIETETFSHPPEIMTSTLPEETPVTVADNMKKLRKCPSGTKSGKDGICEPVESSTIMEIIDESTTSSILPTTATIDLQPTFISNTTEMITESTTGLNDDLGTGGVDNIQGCPKGTEVDEQGACQEILGSSTKMMITDPKVLLNKDGSCPEDYKKINDRCVYVKTTQKSQPFSQDLKTNGNVVGGLQPKSGVDEESNDEVVPVPENNVCPQGTVNSEFGLCKKVTRPSSASLLMKPDGSCPDNYELLNNKCTYKGAKNLGQSDVSVTTISMPLSPIVDEVPVNTDNLFQPTTIVTKL